MSAPALIATGSVASGLAMRVLLEAAEAPSVLDLTPDELGSAMHRAQMRLQLHVAGRVHQMLLDLGAAIGQALTDAAGSDGTLDGLGLILVLKRVGDAWRAFSMGYRRLLEAARRETVALAFGELAVLHRSFFGRLLEERHRPGTSLTEAAVGAGGVTFFQPQLEALLKAANDRIYGDGFRLSQRIWSLDAEGLSGIRSVVYAGVANSKSALQIAKELESFLGAGHECPRWTRYRLYGLTRKQIAGGRRGGLYSGDECKEQGVAYKALRLARTELQYIHHLAAQENRKRMPFVTGERIVLSPAHPQRDICDETIEAAPNGDGVYAVGEVELPVHPNCICTQLSVLMAEDAFVDRLQGWMNRLGPWQELDEYARWVGMGSASVGSPFASPYLAGLELALQLWLLGDEDDHEARLAEAA